MMWIEIELDFTNLKIFYNFLKLFKICKKN